MKPFKISTRIRLIQDEQNTLFTAFYLNHTFSYPTPINANTAKVRWLSFYPTRSSPTGFRRNLQFRDHGNSIPSKNLGDKKAISLLYAMFEFIIPAIYQSSMKAIQSKSMHSEARNSKT